uniref:Uncharacterized protein n=1 Tax=Anguilla anguilla TaxID=7936 RepID=A0A0E9S8W0_ANGAN
MTSLKYHLQAKHPFIATVSQLNENGDEKISSDASDSARQHLTLGE